MIDYSVHKISYEDTKPFILNIHYAKKECQVLVIHLVYFIKMNL